MKPVTGKEETVFSVGNRQKLSEYDNVAPLQ